METARAASKACHSLQVILTLARHRGAHRLAVHTRPEEWIARASQHGQGGRNNRDSGTHSTTRPQPAQQGAAAAAAEQARPARQPARAREAARPQPRGPPAPRRLPPQARLREAAAAGQQAPQAPQVAAAAAAGTAARGRASCPGGGAEAEEEAAGSGTRWGWAAAGSAAPAAAAGPRCRRLRSARCRPAEWSPRPAAPGGPPWQPGACGGCPTESSRRRR